MGRGIVVRVWNLAKQERPFSLTLATGIASATAVTHIETDVGRAKLVGGALEASAAPTQMLTFRLMPARNLLRAARKTGGAKSR